MDSAGEQLHPNWRALATIHLPLKRFIPAGAADNAKGTVDSKAERYKIDGVSGNEVQEFYQEILKTPATCRANHLNQSPYQQAKTKAIQKPKLPFDKNKYFRLATSNKLDELCQMRYTDEDLNSQDAYGWTALMMSACEGATAAVASLLRLGVNIDVADASGNTALTLAKRKGHVEIVRLLETTDILGVNDCCTIPPVEKVLRVTPFYCEICRRTYSESTMRSHQTSTVHRFNSKSLPANKLQKFNISTKNRGLQLMVKQGWDREHGLGPTNTGRLYPVKTVLRKQRTGLGIEQSPARVTHFGAFDTNATKRNGPLPQQRVRTRNDMRREKLRDWKRERRLRNELT